MRTFPIMKDYRRAYTDKTQRRSIPWDVIAPHEAQARRNHGQQTLSRLAERGGLSPCEAIAVLEDRDYELMPMDAAAERLDAIVSAASPAPPESRP